MVSPTQETLKPAETILKSDVNEIYSYEDKTSKIYEKNYQFINNIVKITFEKTWVGKGANCGVDMLGKATVKMQQRDPSLENVILKIIETPTFSTWFGPSPIVHTIEFC